MNQKELIRARTINKSKLEPSSWKNIDRVEIDIGNSIEHETAKFICFILLKNGVLAEQLHEQFDWALKCIDYDKEWLLSYKKIEDFIKSYGQKFKTAWERPVIATEARFKTYFTPTKGEGFLKDAKCVTSNYGRRADLFILDTGEIVEIETDDKIKKEGAITVYI